ncbi:hypothetical protein DJ533_00275 (plasmid) [Acinetobacter defluvii]|uniref:Uncharacterized protein n=1 Tax=Acinetobacter defluvii TaxID=1871111 RepID=A0A2S2F8K3_9GAMM|nr:hypothetical protein [Acinetobacter defluvii]AWL27155.1 hypothetical protein DJ533_00275 [Acinetobacter defluvii]
MAFSTEKRTRKSGQLGKNGGGGLNKKGQTVEEAVLNKQAEDLSSQTVEQVELRQWSGFSNAEAIIRYKELYSLGHFMKAHYWVKFAPYNDNLVGLPLFADDLAGFLVTETSLPLLDAEFDENKVGAYYSNTFTGMREPDIQMTLLDTSDSRIINSLMQIRKAMINDDGTINPPATYAMEISIGLFSKKFGFQVTAAERNFIVAPTQSSLDGLTSKSFEILDVPISFKVLKPYQWK